MRFRKLRIAFSATCLIACVLLIVLWVRSYYWVDQVFVPVTESTYVSLGSVPNAFGGGLKDKSPTGTWAMLTRPTTDWLAVRGPNAPWLGAVTFGIVDGVVIMPYWFGVLLSAAFVMLPWIRRLNWRFSLRTLLIATALFALLLGLVVYASR